MTFLDGPRTCSARCRLGGLSVGRSKQTASAGEAGDEPPVPGWADRSSSPPAVAPHTPACEGDSICRLNAFRSSAAQLPLPVSRAKTHRGASRVQGLRPRGVRFRRAEASADAATSAAAQRSRERGAGRRQGLGLRQGCDRLGSAGPDRSASKCHWPQCLHLGCGTAPGPGLGAGRTAATRRWRGVGEILKRLWGRFGEGLIS